MKRSIKYISVLLSALITAGCCSTVFSAATISDYTDSVKAIYEKIKDGKKVLYDENKNEIPLEELNDDTGNAKNNLPKSYDLRDYGRVSKVKNQGSEGYCWAFASVASMESSILSKANSEIRLAKTRTKNSTFQRQAWCGTFTPEQLTRSRLFIMII